MPIYEYECTQCGQHKEVWQKITEEPISQCTACHGKMKKIISQSSFHLKGTGWYVTDYAKKSSNCTQGSAGGGATDVSSAANEAKGESSAPKSCSAPDSGSAGKECSSSS